MDDSKTYKLMCQMAVKAHPETFYRDSFDSHDYTFKVDGNDVLWPLFRQDQLQEMVAPESKETELYPIAKLLNGFFDFTKAYKFGEHPPTMEQLWLAFVTKEKHGKVWTGTEWKEER